MSKLVIVAEFLVDPAERERFSTLILDNAANSVRTEPGCRQFDVITPQDGAGDRVMLYEVYDDEAAFDAHRQTAHFNRFAEGSQGMIRERKVTRYKFVDGR